MSTADRIEELRKKFDENPRRYFAPLANEYRKAGDLAQAIAICREHLPKQPGHMSGFIVFGQALFESGELPEARLVFEQALALDPENLIALRHLGDIAKANGDSSQARRWYERVLDADPRNDDIAAQLASLTPTPRSSPAVLPEALSFSGSLPVPAYPAPQVPTSSVPTPAFPTPAFPSYGVAPASPPPPVEPLDLDAFVAPTPPSAPLYPTPGIGFAAIPPVAAPTPPYTFASVPTPAYPPPAIDIPPVQTPDSALRAVSEFQTEPTGTPAIQPIHDALDAFAAFDPAHVMDDHVMDDADGTPSIASVAHDLPPGSQPGARGLDALDLDFPEDATPTEPLSFEEGLVAPEWPDTSELVARVVTPLRGGTPVSSPITAAEADAFGREEGDPVDFVDEQADEVEAIEVHVTEEIHVTHVEAVDVDTSNVQPIELEAMVVVQHHVVEEHTYEIHAEIVEDVSDEVSFADVLEPDQISGEAGVDALAVEEQAIAETVAAPVEEVQHVEPADPIAPVAQVNAVEAPDPMRPRIFATPAIGAPAMPTPAGAPAFVTETMAELLVSQGFIARAAEVYEELVRRRPYDPVLTSRLAELRQMVDAAATVVVPTPRSATPVATTPIAVTPLSVPSLDDDAQAPVRRTARERFAELARRRVPRRTPPRATLVVDAPADGLASLFGTAPSASLDDSAARTLADAFGPVAEEGPSLFEPAPAEHEDSRAGAARSAMPQTTPASRPAQSGNAGFSFDRFFPDPASRTTPTASESAPQKGSSEPASGAAPVSEDLAQFSAWLKGLANP